MKIIKSSLLSIGLLLASQVVMATPVTFDFGQSAVNAYNSAHGTSYTTGVNLGTSYTDATSGVTASSYYYDTNTGQWTNSNSYLWGRNEPSNDMGLGVCSPGEGSHCILGAGGNGDWNELSQETNQEVIVLKRPAGYSWDQLLVSSLDNNNGAGPEKGTLYWSGSSNALNVSDFLSGLSGSSSYFQFQNGDFAGGSGTVNGDVLQTANGQASGFDSNAKYVAFISGGPVGSLGGSTTTTSTYSTTTSYGGSWGGGGGSWGGGGTCYKNCTPTTTTGNNDYSVWQGTLTPIPEPGTLALMSLGLAGIAFGRRKSKKNTVDMSMPEQPSAGRPTGSQ